ncbi:hypothetical protein [Nocardia carnea]|uniref:hypothetical protein n=1 Tax=Nocardia carnea TaxID=37328 RepID=UPI002455F716|nr:hypothetical protein [Nocardia carnea]
MQIPAVWTRETWRRAATPTIPAVDMTRWRMAAEATDHHAKCVGHGLWVVSWLPGRTLTEEQARAAMYIAVAPQLPEVARWANRVGLTADEARAYVSMPVVA